MNKAEKKQKILYILELGILLFSFILMSIIFKIKMDNLNNPEIALSCSDVSSFLSYTVYYSLIFICINLFFILNKEYFFKYLLLYIIGLGVIILTGLIFIKLFNFTYDIFNGIDAGIIKFICVSFICAIYKIILKR